MILLMNNLQLKKQYEYLNQSEDFDKKKPVYSLLISPDDKTFESMVSESLELNNKTIWLKWTNFEKPQESIESILRKLVVAEHNAEIAPIDPNTQYIIKSFIDYLYSNFSKIETKTRAKLEFNDTDVVDIANFTLNNKFYYIKRFANKSILIFDENDIRINESVKPILREINEYHKLGVDLYHSTGADKNTRVLGKDIIIHLNEKKTKYNNVYS